MIQQLSIFMENRGGQLIRVLQTLSEAGIQIIASAIADTQDYGIYRVLCNNPERAFEALKAAEVNVQLSEVFALAISDEPGRAAQAIKVLSDANINLLYMYSFLWHGRGVLAFRVDDEYKAQEVIDINNMDLLSEEDFR